MGPAAAPLLPLKAAAPAIADDVGDGTAVAAAALAEKTAVAAQARVNAKMLRLARELRRPNSYVGYIAFILLALCKKCQPCAWEGNNFLSLLEVFAQWALPMSPSHVS